MDEKEFRILWHSNHPAAPTGYGNQTGLFPFGLIEAGYGVDISAFYGVEGYVSVWQNTQGTRARVLPRAVDGYGNDVVTAHYIFCKSDLLITLVDPFVLGDEFAAKTKRHPAGAWCAWAPIDSDPLRRGNVAALKKARWIWAMSRFGERVLTEAGFENVRYVPHGVDFDVFKPLADQREARTRLEKWSHLPAGTLQDKYVIMMNAANKGAPSRKGFAYAFRAFAEAMKADWFLYLHTDPHGKYYGEDLPALLQECGIPPERYCFSASYQYDMGMFAGADINVMYNAADVLLVSSLGEGFGIPIVEAQAAGTPVIGTDCTAITELVRTGNLVRATPFYNGDGINQYIPEVVTLGRALSWWREPQPYQKRSRAEIREQVAEYEWRRVLATRMIPAVEEMRAALAADEVVAEEVGA